MPLTSFLGAYRMVCQKCGSDNTQSLQIVYEGGTQDFNSESRSAGLGSLGGSLGLGGAVTKTTGNTQSKLAQRAAPPAKKKKRWACVGILVGLLFLGKSFGALLIAVLVIGASGYWLWNVLKFNREEWPALHQIWAESWICHKCGNIYRQALGGLSQGA